jgi:acyl-coenzyme A synthetase/AMP-(fatty) acid ligase
MVPYFDFAQDMLIFDSNINKPRRVFGGPKKEKMSYFVATSGTSGKPKLAALSVKNLLSYREAITSIRSLNSSDCLAQTFELGFDVGLGDFLSCLDVGASLLPIDREDVWCMNRVIREASATALSSSPSAAWLNIELGDREPAPSLRATYFLGEPLTNTLCKRWKDRAPNGEIYNLYGPSETTISVAHCRWNQQEQQGDAVPIGFLHVNHQAKEIVQNAQSSRHVSKDVVVREGELVIKGPQVFSGYLTESGWTTGCGLKEGGWYHTGDTVRVLPDGSFVFLSRCDGQIKIGGQRFELEEIEIRLQASLGVRIVAVVREFGNHKKIAAITTSEIAEESIDRAMLSLHKVVPEVFIPREVIRVTSLPMNDNGKVDRLEAAKLIECQAEVLWRI